MKLANFFCALLICTLTIASVDAYERKASNYIEPSRADDGKNGSSGYLEDGKRGKNGQSGGHGGNGGSSAFGNGGNGGDGGDAD